MEDSNLNRSKYDLGATERAQSTVEIEDIIRNIVKNKTEDVTIIIHNIRKLLKDDSNELTDLEIDDILLQLPIVLYDSMEEQEIVGMQSDMANQIYKEAQSEAYRAARGTISDKNAVADLQTRAQQLEKIIYERSYKIIKQKFELAIETLNVVKKVQASRQQKYDIDKYRNRF